MKVVEFWVCDIEKVVCKENNENDNSSFNLDKVEQSLRKWLILLSFNKSWFWIKLSICCGLMTMFLINNLLSAFFRKWRKSPIWNPSISLIVLMTDRSSEILIAFENLREMLFESIWISRISVHRRVFDQKFAVYWCK